MIGLLTPLASFGVVCTMAVAVHMHAIIKGDPFIGGYELAVVYLVAAVMLIITGPCKFSFYQKLFNKS
jgi:putative oxidoreductase